MKLLTFYKKQVEESILPFWLRAFDYEFGGVYTCFNNEGTELLSTDKYVWSQGRYLWILSKLYEMNQKGKIEVDPDTVKKQAGLTLEFLQKNVLLPDGSCTFLLTREGIKKEVDPGTGFDSSIFADCFVLLGFSRYMKAFGKHQVIFEWIWNLYLNVENRIKSNSYKTHPYPTPEGMKTHSIPMIMLNVTQELKTCLSGFDMRKEAYLENKETEYMDIILNEFCNPEYRIGEMLYLDSARDDSILTRHLNPGHSIEDSWFIIHSALSKDRKDIVDKAYHIAMKALELGWDKDSGGILRYVDYEFGGMPQGKLGDDPLSKLIHETWDYKLWWPHSESLYALLLLDSIYQESEIEEWYLILHRYIFSMFPNCYKETGEWIQIRKRNGEPEDRVVALPVKDPYHILRNMLLIIDLLSDNDSFAEIIESKLK